MRCAMRARGEILSISRRPAPVFFGLIWGDAAPRRRIMVASRRVEQIFHQVIQTPELQRPAALERLCGGDNSLLRLVQSLLDEDADPATLASPRMRTDWSGNSEERDHEFAGARPGDMIDRYRILEQIGEG